MGHIVLLDIDGVLAPYNGSRALEQDVWFGGIRNDGVEVETNLRLTCAHYPALIAEINRLIDNGVRVEMLTSWRQDVPLFQEHTGMHSTKWHGILPQSSEDDLIDWWKLAVVQKLIAENPDLHILWADDDINFDPMTVEWLNNNPRVQTICPPTQRGLTPADVATIEAFATAHPN